MFLVRNGLAINLDKVLSFQTKIVKIGSEKAFMIIFKIIDIEEREIENWLTFDFLSDRQMHFAFCEILRHIEHQKENLIQLEDEFLDPENEHA